MTVPRQQQILDTAAKLFAERGFHGVSVHDIGNACGISGPALYKHFASKIDILTQSLTAISERLLAEGLARRDAASTPGEALESLIAWHISFALSNPALIVIQEREWGNLDSAGRKEVRSLQLAYIDVWVETVRSLRGDLDPQEARACVQATFGMLNSTPHSARISAPEMRARLARMGRAALLS